MNVFNRLLALLLGLLLLLGGLLVAVLRLGLLMPNHPALAWLTATPLGAWLAQFAETQFPLAPTVAIALGVALIGLLLLWAELRPPRRETQVVLRADGLGRVTIQHSSLHHLIAYLAAQTPDILQVQPTVASTPQGLRVHCRTSLRPDANLAETATAFQQRVKEAIERSLGLKVAAVIVDTQFEPLARSTAIASAPARRQLR